MNQKEPFLRRILPYLLNENSHMGLFGPLYLLWHCEYQTCLRWYGLPAALLVLAHGALSWGVGHALPLLAQGAGYAMAACRDPSVPCHRVVDRFGGTKAAFDTYAPGTQRALLEMEGVPFRLDGTVDLERCQWDPEADA